MYNAASMLLATPLKIVVDDGTKSSFCYDLGIFAGFKTCLISVLPLHFMLVQSSAVSPI